VKAKLISILGMMLLIATAVFPVSEGIDKINDSSTGGIELVPLLCFNDPRILSLGYIPFILENRGNGAAYDITYEMRVIERGGLFGGELFSPKEIVRTYPYLGPGEIIEENLEITGIGITTIYFACRYKIEYMYGCDIEFEIKQELTDLGLLSLHLFLPSMQPKKEWMEVDDYWYYNESDQGGVELYFEDICQKHNVRVSMGSGSWAKEVLFKASCKFYDGIGILEECGITREIVESGEAYWEVELVDGG